MRRYAWCRQSSYENMIPPTSTFNHFLAKLNGSKIFTKLDVKIAFRQIELDQNSQYITAFQSDICIKSFKRLNFGGKFSSLRIAKCFPDHIQTSWYTRNDYYCQWFSYVWWKHLGTWRNLNMSVGMVWIQRHDSQFSKKPILSKYGSMFSEKGMKTFPEEI